MKPYNCNCLYEVQVRELKQQKDELLKTLNTTVQQFKLVQPLYTRDKQIIESAEQLIQKLSNENT